MPSPIPSNDRSDSTPSDWFDRAACDPSVASCAPPLATATGPSRSVTLEPVYVPGDSGSASRELVRRYDASLPACQSEVHTAELSCLLAAVAAANTALSAPTGIGLVLGTISAAGLGARCARDVVAAVDCKAQSEARADFAADCTARGGVSLTGANAELVCLVTR